MNNQEKIDNITFYQQSGIGHPLTCVNDSKHLLLEAVEFGGSDGVVMLRCPSCNQMQDHIPKIPSNEDIIKMKKVMEDMLATSLKEPEPESEHKEVSIRIVIDTEITVYPQEDETMEQAIARELDDLRTYREDLWGVIDGADIRNAKVTLLDT